MGGNRKQINKQNRSENFVFVVAVDGLVSHVCTLCTHIDHFPTACLALLIRNPKYGFVYLRVQTMPYFYCSVSSQQQKYLFSILFIFFFVAYPWPSTQKFIHGQMDWLITIPHCIQLFTPWRNQSYSSMCRWCMAWCSGYDVSTDEIFTVNGVHSTRRNERRQTRLEHECNTWCDVVWCVCVV